MQLKCYCQRGLTASYTPARFCVGGAFAGLLTVQHRLFAQQRRFLINQSAMANSYANYGTFIYLYAHMYYIFNWHYAQY